MKILSYLRAVDDGGSGIDYDTALTAYSIVVATIWSGFFATHNQDTDILVPVAQTATTTMGPWYSKGAEGCKAASILSADGGWRR